MHHSVVEGSLNCLAVNHDCTQVVVAGRNGKQEHTVLDTRGFSYKRCISFEISGCGGYVSHLKGIFWVPSSEFLQFLD